MRAVAALREFCRTQQVDENTLFALSLALEECASNIVNHSLRRDAQETFRMALGSTGTAIVIELRDRGPQFDPTGPSVVQEEPGGKDREPGGWGIQLARRFMDEMLYTREGGENVLRLIKSFDAPAEKDIRRRQ